MTFILRAYVCGDVERCALEGEGYDRTFELAIGEVDVFRDTHKLVELKTNSMGEVRTFSLTSEQATGFGLLRMGL